MMEEASTLSDRAAIQNRRLLAVSGTRDLVKQHGRDFYHVHMTLARGVNATVRSDGTCEEVVRDFVSWHRCS
jgi:hypothetical protein